MMATPVPLTGTIQYSTAECCSSLHLHHSEVRYSTVQQSVVLLFTCTIQKYVTVQYSRVLFFSSPAPFRSTLQYSTTECCSSFVTNRREEKRRDEATLEENPA